MMELMMKMGAQTIAKAYEMDGHVQEEIHHQQQVVVRSVEMD